MDNALSGGKILRRDYLLRPAVSDDLELIWQFQKESMRPHVEAQTGVWEEDARRERILSSDPAAYEIIMVEGQPIGCCMVESLEDALRLVRLYLLPAYQGRGIGSAFMRDLCVRANSSRIPINLRVYKVSPAKRLYERFGFETTCESDTHYHMIRQPGGSQP